MERFFLTLAIAGIVPVRLHVVGMLEAASVTAATAAFRCRLPRHDELEGMRLEAVPVRLATEGAASTEARSWGKIPGGFAYGGSVIVGKVRSWRLEYEVSHAEATLACAIMEAEGYDISFDEALEQVRRERRRPHRARARRPVTGRGHRVPEIGEW